MSDGPVPSGIGRTHPEGLLSCCRASGSSMAPLIRDGDLVTVVYAAPGSVRRGDIVSFTRSGCNLLHRVIAVRKRNGTVLFRTRGDSCLAADRGWIRSDRLNGRADEVRKKSITINLAGGFGRVLSSSGMLLARAGVRLEQALKTAAGAVGRLRRIFSCRNIPENIFVNDVFGVSAADRGEMLSGFIGAASGTVPEGAAVLELNPGSGFSEEALWLARNGRQVETKSFESIYADRDRLYGAVLMLGLVDLFPLKADAAGLVSRAAERLEKGGTLIVSYQRYRLGFSQYPSVFFRALAGLLRKGNSCPPSALFAEGVFVRRKYSEKELLKMFLESGLRHLHSGGGESSRIVTGVKE